MDEVGASLGTFFIILIAFRGSLSRNGSILLSLKEQETKSAIIACTSFLSGLRDSRESGPSSRCPRTAWTLRPILFATHHIRVASCQGD